MLSSYFLLLYYSSSSNISFSAFSFSSFILLSLDLSSESPFFTLSAAEVEAFKKFYSPKGFYLISLLFDGALNELNVSERLNGCSLF